VHAPVEVGDARVILVGSGSGGVTEEKEKAEKAAARARQDAIMKQFAAAQKSFLDACAAEEDGEDDEGELEDGADGAGGPSEDEPTFGTCIVCQEELRAGQRPFGALCYVQPSRIVWIVRKLGGRALDDALVCPTSLDRVFSEDAKMEKPSAASVKGKGKAQAQAGSANLLMRLYHWCRWRSSSSAWTVQGMAQTTFPPRHVSRSVPRPQSTLRLTWPAARATFSPPLF
jgi:hypothetical protein